MKRYYINTKRPQEICIILDKGETLEELGIPEMETWGFVECNILEYWLFRYLGINEKVGIKYEFHWVKYKVIRWLSS